MFLVSLEDLALDSEQKKAQMYKQRNEFIVLISGMQFTYDEVI